MTTPKNHIELSDREVDHLLQSATHPRPPADFEPNLLARINTATPSNVVAFPRQRKSSLWITGLSLAASLILGLWLGSSNQAASLLPFSTDTIAQSISALLPADGATTLYSLTEDSQS
jgi:hypothetical protein